MTRSIVRAAGAAAFALALAAALGACASDDLTSASAQVVKSTRTRLDSLSLRINGSNGDRSAALFSQYVAYQLPLRDCMAAHGLSYAPPKFADGYSTFPDRPLDSVEALIPIDTDHQARGLYLAEELRAAQTLQQPVDNPGFTRLDEPGRAAYRDQVTRCTAHPATYATLDAPPAAPELSAKLTAALEKALDHPAMHALTATYPACMQEHGFPQVQSRHALTSQTREKHFADLTPVPGQKIDDNDPRLVAAHAAELVAAIADAACRKDSYPMAITLVGPAVQAFEHDHAVQLAELDKAWIAKHDQAMADRNKIDWVW